MTEFKQVSYHTRWFHVAQYMFFLLNYVRTCYQVSDSTVCETVLFLPSFLSIIFLSFSKVLCFCFFDLAGSVFFCFDLTSQKFIPYVNSKKIFGPGARVGLEIELGLELLKQLI